mgnify:FL=1
MHINLGTITSENLDTIRSKLKEDLRKMTNGTTVYNGSKTIYGIIDPWPWRRPWDNDEGNTYTLTRHKYADEKPKNELVIDMFENSDRYIVKADLPGYDADSIKLKLDEDGNLVIEAERIPDTSAYSYSVNSSIIERTVGKIQRTIEISDSIDFDKSDAVFIDGVLTITLYKSEVAPTRFIPVKKG